MCFTLYNKVPVSFRWLPFAAVVILFGSCRFFKGAEEGLHPVARVFDKYLYKEDLLSVIPPGTRPEDSVAIARTYIDNWIKQNVIIAQAELNLTDDQKNFDLQVENYRNSLLIYTYEKNLVDQKLDTSVSEAELMEYYKANLQNLRLMDCAVKVYYIKLDSGKHDGGKITRLIRSNSARDLEELRSYCQNYAVEYFFNDRTWIYCNELGQRMPLSSQNRQSIADAGAVNVINNSGFTYYVYTIESKSANEIPPIDLVQDDIKLRIINKRKMELIDQMRTDLLNDALNNKNAETFDENED